MSSKIKQNGKKRACEFKAACTKLNLTSRSFFFSAATEANDRNEGRAGWKHLDREAILRAFGEFELAEVMGKFEAPRYVHEKIDRTNGVRPAPRPRPALKGRLIRRSRSHGMHAAM